MFGYSPIGVYSVADANNEVMAEEPIPIATIDATKVPPSRRVVFEGSKRVVSFYGSINIVRF